MNGTSGDEALGDDFGHGTHVAGILAGEQETDQEAFALVRERNEMGDESTTRKPVSGLRGVAPECEIVSLRVLDGDGNGAVTAIMEALDYVNTVNMHGRNLRIHGVNLSVGYEFNAEWFACGQSPLCVEVDRLVRSGVVVVVAAGNTGYGQIRAKERPTATAGLDLTINDPGNAERAITVGSTHASEPHTYGVSFFSSKGPTGDGRNKPDLVAPGERIVSCAAGTSALRAGEGRRPGRALPRAIGYEHGGAARVRCGRRVPVDPFGVHRTTRARQGAPGRLRHRPRAQFVLPGKRPTRSHARHPGRVTSIRRQL